MFSKLFSRKVSAPPSDAAIHLVAEQAAKIALLEKQLADHQAVIREQQEKLPRNAIWPPTPDLEQRVELAELAEDDSPMNMPTDGSDPLDPSDVLEEREVTVRIVPRRLW